MKNLLSQFIFILFPIPVFALDSSDTIPINRRVFHDHIIKEQHRADWMDGKPDTFIKISNVAEVNFQVTDAIFRKVNTIRNSIEKSTALPTSNDKIRYLRLLELLVKNFNSSWKSHKISAVNAPKLVENFSEILKANLKGESMAPYIEKNPYEVGIITSEIFKDNLGYKESRKHLFLKYSQIHPDKILSTIGPYIDESFAEELVLIAYHRSPSQIYTYAQAANSPQGKLLKKHPDNRIKTVVQLSTRKDALFYFPFLDNLITGKQTIEDISKYVSTDSAKYDSVGYYKLLVRTEIDYYNRVNHKDTPVAMFGVNGLTDMLRSRAIKHFVTPINDLHDVSNPAIRFKAIVLLNPQDLYYMLVLSENEIFTTSYRNAFDIMLKRMGAKPRGDSLLLSVNSDHFRRFIKMAAGYNKLDMFLWTMKESSEILMKAFVANLESSPSLEDAVDVADSYGSIKDPALLSSLLKYVSDNELRCVDNGNQRGQRIYKLLKMIFLSADSTKQVDLTKETGIPPVYTVEYNSLTNASGKIIQQVFFYGDKDGKESFSSFIQSFKNADWKITTKREWVEIKSLKGKPVWIYANRPLDNENDKDAAAQIALINYLDTNNFRPSIVIHRGHSYHAKYTIEQLPESAKIIMFGSCGGFNNLKQILEYAPEAHIISTKQIGAMDVNKPILQAINNTLRAGQNIDWKQMWNKLDVLFSKAGRVRKDLFDDYIPPHKNLGALFIKAYSKTATPE